MSIPTTSQKSSFETVQIIVSALQDRKGKDINILDLKNVGHAITDYFVLVTATSDTQVDSLRENVEKEVAKQVGLKPLSAEGRQNREWVILDYFDVVVHVFLKEKREHFGLEQLWGDAKLTEIEDL